MPRPRKYPIELMDRGVRLVSESGRPIAQIARDLGVPPEALWNALGLTETGFVGLSSNYTELV
jgi:transposase-like protein